CKKRAFITGEDMVLIQKVVGNYVCAEFTNDRHFTSIGFLPKRSLIDTPAPVVPLRAWVGQWRGNAEQNIEIRRGCAVGSISVTGGATYGALDSERVRKGAVNIGSLEA